jgi:transposase
MWKTRIELEHQIVTLGSQGLPRRAIARALGVSRNTVRKILEAHGQERREPQTAVTPPRKVVPRPRKIDDFRGKVTELLGRYPDITARRIFEELCAAGYAGFHVKPCEAKRRH